MLVNSTYIYIAIILFSLGKIITTTIVITFYDKECNQPL